MVAEVGYPELLILLAEIDSREVADQALRTFQNAQRSDIAISRGVENQDGTAAVVSDKQLIAFEVQAQCGRPVHLRFRTLNDTNGRLVAFDVLCVNRDGRRQQLARAGNGIL